MSRRLRRAAGQRGVTLVELLLAMLISSILLAPVLAWMVSAFNQNETVRQASANVSAASLLNMTFPGDVMSANKVWAAGDGTNPLDVSNSGSPLWCSDGGTTVHPSTTLASFQTYADFNAGERPMRTVFRDEVDAQGRRSLIRERCQLLANGSPMPGTTLETIGSNLGTPSSVACKPSAGVETADNPHCTTIYLSVASAKGGSPLKLTAQRRVALEVPPPLANKPPIARFTLSPATGTRPLDVMFDATTSDDPEGGALLYSWDFDSDALPATTPSSSPTYSKTFTYPANSTQKETTYTATLTVYDNGTAADGTAGIVLASVISRTITVQNNPPFGELTSVPSTAFTGQSTAFSAAGVQDPDGSVLRYQWNFGSGATPANSTAANPSVVWSSRGLRTVSFTATDDAGDQWVTAFPVDVLNQNPIAKFTQSYTGGVLTLDASSSEGSTGLIDGYSWTLNSWGGTTVATGTNPLLVQAVTPGSYKVFLTVTESTTSKSASISPNPTDITIGGTLPDPKPTVSGEAVSGVTLSWPEVLGAGSYQVQVTYTDLSNNKNKPCVQPALITNYASTSYTVASPTSPCAWPATVTVQAMPAPGATGVSASAIVSKAVKP